jgi:hypothetical protein
MKAFLKNIAIGIPLAIGLMLTLVAIALVLRGGDDLLFGVMLGLVSIPLLFATLASIMRE